MVSLYPTPGVIPGPYIDTQAARTRCDVSTLGDLTSRPTHSSYEALTPRGSSAPAAMGRVVITLSDLEDALPTPASRTRSASTPPPRRRTLPQQGRGRRSGIWRGWGAAGAIERSSFDDEQPLGNPGPRRRRWFESPHCVPQVCSVDL
jgi:hypothetical protein